MDYDGKGTGAGAPQKDGDGSSTPRRAMTVSEAGRKGGQRVRELIERGKTRG